MKNLQTLQIKNITLLGNNYLTNIENLSEAKDLTSMKYISHTKWTTLQMPSIQKQKKGLPPQNKEETTNRSN